MKIKTNKVVTVVLIMGLLSLGIGINIEFSKVADLADGIESFVDHQNYDLMCHKEQEEGISLMNMNFDSNGMFADGVCETVSIYDESTYPQMKMMIEENPTLFFMVEGMDEENITFDDENYSIMIKVDCQQYLILLEDEELSENLIEEYLLSNGLICNQRISTTYLFSTIHQYTPIIFHEKIYFQNNGKIYVADNNGRNITQIKDDFEYVDALLFIMGEYLYFEANHNFPKVPREASLYKMNLNTQDITDMQKVLIFEKDELIKNDNNPHILYTHRLTPTSWSTNTASHAMYFNKVPSVYREKTIILAGDDYRQAVLWDKEIVYSVGSWQESIDAIYQHGQNVYLRLGLNRLVELDLESGDNRSIDIPRMMKQGPSDYNENGIIMVGTDNQLYKYDFNTQQTNQLSTSWPTENGNIGTVHFIGEHVVYSNVGQGRTDNNMIKIFNINTKETETINDVIHFQVNIHDFYIVKSNGTIEEITLG